MVVGGGMKYSRTDGRKEILENLKIHKKKFSYKPRKDVG
jgi:hypothetical protein